MYKKTITYKDYDGNERTEDFYFNLTEAEITEMELEVAGGMTKKVERIVQAQDSAQIIDVFKDLIRRSYGEKSPDGRRFVKSAEVLQNFIQTEAYSQLFMELATDSKAAAAFFNAIVPQRVAESMAADTTLPAPGSTPILTEVK